jgi:hypothetical protein
MTENREEQRAESRGFIKVKMEMEMAVLFIGESVYRVAGSC